MLTQTTVGIFTYISEFTLSAREQLNFQMRSLQKFSNHFKKKNCICPHTFEVAKNDARTRKAGDAPKTNLAGVM